MREGICKSDRACVRLSYAFLEHKGCFNEQAGTELGVTPGFSNSSVTELPGKSPGCDLHGKRSMFWAEFDFHGKPGPDCSRSAGTGASSGPNGTRCWGLSFPHPPPEWLGCVPPIPVLTSYLWAAGCSAGGWFLALLEGGDVRGLMQPGQGQKPLQLREAARAPGCREKRNAGTHCTFSFCSVFRGFVLFFPRAEQLPGSGELPVTV